MVVMRLKEKTFFLNEPILEKELFRIITLNKNRLFIFIITPYHHSFFNRYENIKTAQNFLNSLNKITNVKVLDFSKITYSDKYFFDTKHLNFAGVIEFNKTLRDSLDIYIK